MKPEYGIISIFVFTVILIIVYTLIMYAVYGANYINKDIMNQIVFENDSLSNMGKFMPFDRNNNIKCCSGWNISHFILFAVLSFLWPDCIPLLFGAGVLWEIVESTTGIATYKINKKIKLVDIKPAINSKSVSYDYWWSGNYADIIFNSAGLAFGYALNRAFKK